LPNPPPSSFRPTSPHPTRPPLLRLQLSHPAIIALYAAWKDPTFIYLALEWADNVGAGEGGAGGGTWAERGEHHWDGADNAGAAVGCVRLGWARGHLGWVGVGTAVVGGSRSEGHQWQPLITNHHGGPPPPILPKHAHAQNTHNTNTHACMHAMQGNVWGFLQSLGGVMDERTAVPLIVEPTMSALSYIHSLGMIHRWALGPGVLGSGGPWDIHLGPGLGVLGFTRSRTNTWA
jgi:hypothetical protein